jgi:putative ABC transport system permease protein
MTSVGLAWRTARRYRARTLLAVAGVAIIGALLFDMLLLSRGLLASFADLLDSEGFDVRVIASEGLPMMRVPIPGSADLADRIRGMPSVRDVALLRMERARIRRGTDRPRVVTLVGRTQSGVGPWTVVRGANLPYGPVGSASVSGGRRDCPVVVGRNLATAFALEPGSSIDVTATPAGIASALPSVACRVVGLVDFGFAGVDEYAVATTMDAFETIVAEPSRGDADLILVASRAESGGGAAAARAIAALRPDLRVYSNEDVVAQFNRNGFAYFRQISFVLSSLTMSFAFLLVATLLTVSINQRLGEIAALRALGIGRRRIAAMLLWESALLVGAGALLALPLGGVLALLLDHILRQMPGLPQRLHFFVFEPRALIIHVMLFVITAAAAAAYPVWLTSRLPIAATLRREVVG